MKWSLLKTIIWIDKTNLRAHDLESLLEKTYEAGTKGRQISYKKEAQGFCDLSLEWNHILSMTVKLVLFDVNIFEHFGYWSKLSNYWMTEILKFLKKFNKLREPSQSKLSYVDEERQSDPRVI